MHATFPSSNRLETIGLAGDEGPFLEPLEPPARKRWPWHLALLLILTALAGVSRFYKLDHPPIWGDEASTFRRVSGTYEEMLVTLERDPFGPLFYEIEWAIRQFHPLTPFWLRLVPAIAGTLMIPAMYFLTRQVASIRTALAAAILTLCSAWLINYGRDAKIYMSLWLFTTLSAGCFLWWVRSHTWTAWLAWIAASSAMVGFDVRAAILLALTPVWMLVARRVHWSMGVGLLVGLLVISVGPVGYYTQFNHWRDKVQENGHFTDIEWVRERNDGASGLDLVQDSAAAYLYSFTFIQESAGRPLPPRPVLVESTIALTIIVALLALGALPWRRLHGVPASAGMEIEPETGMPRGLKPARREGARSPPSSPEPWWRPTLWIGLWLVVPTYLFYCISVHDSASPLDWIPLRPDLPTIIAMHGWFVGVPLAVITSGYAWTFVILTIATMFAVMKWPRLSFIFLGLPIFVAGVLLLYGMKLAYTGPADANAWHRPIDSISQWLALLGNPRFVWPASIMIAGVALLRSGRTFRRCFGNVLIAAAILLVAGFLLLQIHTACAAALKNMEAQGVHPSSIWVPRYLGFIWPAVILTVATLLMRLPTWPVKWLAVIAVCALNLYVANNRVLGHTEPPIDRIVADIHAGEAKDSPTRTFIQNAEVGSGPGGGSLFGHVGKYYFLNDRTDITLSPEIFSDWERGGDQPINRMESPGRISNTLKNAPGVNKLIVWRPIFRDGQTPQDQDIPVPPADVNDALLQRLGPTWKRTSDEVIPVRYHWSWAELYLYRRREYEKQPADISVEASSSTTKPTTRP